MTLLQLLTKTLEVTALFYILILFFGSISHLTIPEQAYTEFGFLTAYVFFFIVLLQLPNNNANNKSAEKTVAKAVG